MDSIEIRKYKKEDIADFHAAVIDSKKEISKWLPWCHDNYTKVDAEKWITELVPTIWQSKKGCEFIIVNNSKNKIAGGCCLEQIDWNKKEANVGYWIRTSETRQGLATKACYFLLHYGFQKLGLEQINVIPSVENIASVKVAEKLPFEKRVMVKNGFKIRNQISDALVFTITKKSLTKEKSYDFQQK